MRELRGQRPRGIGDVEAAQPVDGDDLTWDWWQALSAVGDLSHADADIFGTLYEGQVHWTQSQVPGEARHGVAVANEDGWLVVDSRGIELIDGPSEGKYDTRTCAERHNWHDRLLLQRIQQLERRLASVEAVLDRWTSTI